MVQSNAAEAKIVWLFFTIPSESFKDHWILHYPRGTLTASIIGPSLIIEPTDTTQRKQFITESSSQSQDNSDEITNLIFFDFGLVYLQS